jgi:WD40 repeat protein
LAFTGSTKQESIGTIRIWNPSIGKEWPAIDRAAHFQDLGFNSLGQLWTTIGRDLTFWDAETGRPINQRTDPLERLFGENVTIRTAVVQLDRAFIADNRGRVRCLDTSANPIRERLNRSVSDSPLRALAASADGNLLVVGDLQGMLMLIRSDDLATRAINRQAHAAEIVSVAALHNNTLMSASRDRTIRFWRVDGAELVELLTLRMPGPIRQAIVAPDNRKLYVLIEAENRVRCIHLELIWKQLRGYNLDPAIPFRE